MGNTLSSANSKLKQDIANSSNSFKHLHDQFDNLQQTLLKKEKSIKDLSSKNNDLKQKLFRQEHEIEQLNKQLLSKQNNNLTLIQKNLSLGKLNRELFHLSQKTDDEIADDIIACNSKDTHNDDWFYNMLYERKNFIEAIKYFRPKIKPILT
jgi:predicted RNase H-like nuclease (RuvC/YqgF family)